MSNQTTSAAMRSAPLAMSPIAIVGSAFLTCSLVLADVTGPIRPVVVLGFLCLVPGVAVVRRFDLDSWAIRAALALSLSLTLDGVTAGLLLYAHLWSPEAMVFIVAGIAVTATVQEADGLAYARARLGMLSLGERLAAAAAGALRTCGDLRLRLWVAKVDAARLLRASSRRPASRRVRVLRRTARQVRWRVRAARTWLLARRPRVSIHPRLHPHRRGGAHGSESLLFERLVVNALQARSVSRGPRALGERLGSPEEGEADLNGDHLSWQAVRRLLTLKTTQEIEPQIWLIEDLELRGRSHEGSPPAAPAGVWVTAVTDTLGVPLDWRVLLDAAPHGRRAWRSRLALEALDWLCALDCVPPVIAAGPGYGSLRGFRDGLEVRQLDYLVRVEPAIALDEVAPTDVARRGRRAADSRSLITDYLRARQIELEPFSWTEAGRRSVGAARSRVVHSRFGALRLDAPGPEVHGRRGRHRWLVCEWPAGEEQPVRFWFSNLPNGTSISHFASLAKLPARADLVGSRPGNILAGQPERPTSTVSLDQQLTLWVLAQEFRALKAHRAVNARP
jgi:hypothetical protein